LIENKLVYVERRSMWLVLLIAMVARRCGLVPVYMAVGPREALSVLGRKPDGRRRVRLGVGEKKETFSPDNNTYGYERTTDGTLDHGRSTDTEIILSGLELKFPFYELD
jgi:hypothetical protein